MGGRACGIGMRQKAGKFAGTAAESSDLALVGFAGMLRIMTAALSGVDEVGK